MIKYLIPFITAFFLAVGIFFGLVPAAGKIFWKKRKSKRHIHKENVYRIGGIAMMISFVVTILIDNNLFISPELYGIMFASIVLTAIGLWDDIKELHWKLQLFFQISVAFFIFIVGVRIYYVTNPLTGGIFHMESGLWVIVSAVAVIFWAVLVINAMNWLDGIDGLSGGITLITAITIFFLSLEREVNQPPVAIVAAIFAGSVLAFLIFNVNPAKILAGSSGSMFMGFILASLAIFAGTKIATAILVLFIPIIDFIWVILQRQRQGKSIFHPDQNHLHHKLLSLGWSQWKITLAYCLVTAVVAFVALNTRAIGKGVTLIFSAIIMIFTLVIIDRRLKEKKA